MGDATSWRVGQNQKKPEAYKEEACSEPQVKYWIKNWKERRNKSRCLSKCRRAKIKPNELISNFHEEPSFKFNVNVFY